MDRKQEAVMAGNHTIDELNNQSKHDLVVLFLSLQEQFNDLNSRYKNLIEQIRAADQQRYGRKTEKSSELYEQLSFFNEAEKLSENNPEEPTPDEVLPAQPPKKKKQKGKRDQDLKGLPEENISHLRVTKVRDL
jgi:hypothetical protein